MINAMAHTITNQTSSARLVSSTYLVMLRRYLDYLRDGAAPHGEQGMYRDAADYLESMVELDHIAPVIEQIKALKGHSSFGLEIGKHMHPSDYGIFGYAMMNCMNLYKALKTAAKYKSILNKNVFARFFEEDDQVTYQLNSPISDHLQHILIELDFSAALQFARLLVGPLQKDDLKLTSVHFMHAPLGPVDLYKQRFQCPVFFSETTNKIRVSRKALRTPIYGANHKVLAVIEEKIIGVSKHIPNTDHLLSKKVTHYLNQQELTTLPSATETAQAFNMSLSSFKKHLRDEETCFQNLCDAIRQKRCVELMRVKTMSIKQIAYELGFANPSAFNRAFKRWTGQNPTLYRKSMPLNDATFRFGLGSAAPTKTAIRP